MGPVQAVACCSLPGCQGAVDELHAFSTRISPESNAIISTLTRNSARSLLLPVASPSESTFLTPQTVIAEIFYFNRRKIIRFLRITGVLRVIISE